MLRASALFTVCFVALNAFAGQYDFLRGNEGAQKEFRTLLESGNYSQALMAWETSYFGTPFSQSPTGIATWAYLLYQNGLPYTALETLIQNTSPAQIDPQLVKIWSTELKKSQWIQKGWIVTTGGWKTVVNNEPVSILIKNKNSATLAFQRASKLGPENINEKARIWWQIATQSPQIGDLDSSLKALKLLRESGQTAIGQDMINMTQGRVLYQKKDLAAALNFYQQVPKSSSLWLEAVEERAWTHLRMEDYDKAFGVVNTAISPVFAPLAGPETFFLANLMAYRVCDYPRVFSNSEIFKKRHKMRLNEIQELAQKGSSAKMNQIFDRFEQSGVSQESAGPLVEAAPRQLFHDQQFIRYMESRRQVIAEVNKATQLFDQSKALGINPELERMLIKEKQQADELKQKAYSRARTLAQVDLKEYHVVLNKMHVIEGEIIERLHLDDNLKGQRSKLSKNDDKGDVLVFPSGDEVWMDELDNYKARVKDCPTLKGASL